MGKLEGSTTLMFNTEKALRKGANFLCGAVQCGGLVQYFTILAHSLVNYLPRNVLGSYRQLCRSR